MPNRILKESIRTSAEINALNGTEESFFYRLLTLCDDFGRYDARPAVIRGHAYPLRLGRVSEGRVATMLAQLVTIGLVWLYEVEGRPYLQVTRWEEHQQRRAKHSKFPDPSIGKRLPAPDSTRKHVQANVPENRGVEESRSRGVEDRESSKSAGEPRPKNPSDLQTYCLDRLREANPDAWSEKAAPWSLIVKLNGRYGRPVVTTALQHVYESGGQETKKAAALLVDECKRIAAEEPTDAT